jgi:hypothetical protein
MKYLDFISERFVLLLFLSIFVDRFEQYELLLLFLFLPYMFAFVTLVSSRCTVL